KIQAVEIGKNNRIEQTPIHDLNLPANPHGYWLFGSLDFQSGNMISSRSRYDHFDTSPYLSQHQHLRKRGELMGRTKKNIQLKIPEKPRKIKGFRSGSYRIATTISSRSRYDHFDTSPYLIFKHRLARYLEKCKISMQDNAGKIGCTPKEKPTVKPFLADKLTKR
ncbi:hypothetical protein, partial [Candidatus Allofournierella merdipullorum]|uniref:hypothetical protein n=1 Tax=Candidatus Allofournierella merdipullorum TaxID=2838595 RepID=UPI002A8EDFF8|nr:hypothetical protein [Candidatus Fournierella merdipullorum]